MISVQHDGRKGGIVAEDTEQQQTPASGMNLAEIVAQGNAETLRRYWAFGEGARLIRWGTPGDFMRCVRRVNKYMTDEQARGFCNERHQDALGVPPGGED